MVHFTLNCEFPETAVMFFLMFFWIMTHVQHTLFNHSSLAL